MGLVEMVEVEVCTSVNTILSQLEKEKRGLQKIDEHIKKSQVSGRFQNDRNLDRSFQGNDGPRGGGRNLNRSFHSDISNRSFDEDNRTNRKRPQETKTVFSRLSGRIPADSDGEDEVPFPKRPKISSQVIRELPTKQEVLKAQSGDEVSKVRNRRMFGSLLGTLQKFKQEEIILKNKEEKKAQIEKKIEEQAKQEKENQKRERQNLFAERELKKASIKALEAKMTRLESYEAWEKTQKPLLNYIQTKWKPHICWLPKKMSNQAKEKYDMSRTKQEKIIEDKQKELKEELNAIEQNCLRNMKLPPGVKKRPKSLSEALDQSASDAANQSTEHNQGDNEENGTPSAHEEEEEPPAVVANIKQEKEAEKLSRDITPKVNVKIEGESKKKKPDTDSDSSSESSSEEEGEHHTSSSSEDDNDSQNVREVSLKNVKMEVNGDCKKEAKTEEAEEKSSTKEPDN